MRAQKQVRLFLPLSFVACMGLSTSAIAADINTYRPGKAYLKSVASSPDQCAIQCTGDAKCRGWNFVMPQPNVQTGICEFNANIATPVFSAVSVSGENLAEIDQYMGDVIQGGTRTIRVGSPQVNLPVVNPKPPANTAQSSRRVIRQPVPGQTQKTILASHGTPVRQAATPRIYSQSPAQAPVATMPSPPPMAVSASRAAPTPQQKAFYREQYLRAQQAQKAQMTRQPIRAQQAQPTPYPASGPAPAMAPAYPPGHAANVQAQQAMEVAALKQHHLDKIQSLPSQSQAPAETSAPAPSPASVMAIPPSTVPSLFGNLHDDLTTMTPVPRTQTAPDNPTDPNAPMSTAVAVPAKPVTTEPLSNAAIMPGLAGG